LGVLAVVALAACGGKDDTDTSGGTATGAATTTPAGTYGGTPSGTTAAGSTGGTSDCAFGGTVSGCLAYEAECATPDASYTVDGGWFDDSQAGLMVIRFANNQSDQYWELNIATDEITVGVPYTWPANLTGSLVNVSNPTTTDLTSICLGRVTITDWEPGVTVSGEWKTQSELGSGPCTDAQFWSGGGVFSDLAPCRP
jgi:hypothetical protein